ncbi:MAG: hypothetical protein LBT00_08775 [Spirochaetaceae bacterium]|nr:hypothetical protein [Spirochaetaceae bacterium]
MHGFNPPVIASESPVIASEAKQSRVKAFLGWIASLLLATQVATSSQ